MTFAKNYLGGVVSKVATLILQSTKSCQWEHKFVTTLKGSFTF